MLQFIQSKHTSRAFWNSRILADLNISFVWKLHSHKGLSSFHKGIALFLCLKILVSLAGRLPLYLWTPIWSWVPMMANPYLITPSIEGSLVVYCIWPSHGRISHLLCTSSVNSLLTRGQPILMQFITCFDIWSLVQARVFYFLHIPASYCSNMLMLARVMARVIAWILDDLFLATVF